MNKFIYTLLVSVFMLSGLWYNVYALSVGTYSAPPFSMHEDGEDIGMATEAVRDLLSKSGIMDYKVVTYPLARGLVELENGRVDVFYPYVSAHKANLEKLVMIGPIAKYRVAIFVRKDYSQNVSLDAMQNMVLSAERGSIADLLLLNRDMHVEQATQEISCLKMTLAQRVVGCALGTLPGMYVSAINNMYEDFRYVETGVYADMFVALGPNVPQETVALIQKTFSKLKQEKYFEKQQKDYEKKFKVFIESLS